MEIIKERNKAFKCKCSVCETVFCYTAKEIGGVGNDTHIRCPVCNTEISHPTKSNFALITYCLVSGFALGWYVGSILKSF